MAEKVVIYDNISQWYNECNTHKWNQMCRMGLNSLSSWTHFSTATALWLFQSWQKYFLFLDTVLGDSPNQLTETESYLSLVDTGFFINTSTPPLLRPQRKVDVILHLNYSAGSQILVRKINLFAIFWSKSYIICKLFPFRLGLEGST